MLGFASRLGRWIATFELEDCQTASLDDSEFNTNPLLPTDFADKQGPPTTDFSRWDGRRDWIGVYKTYNKEHIKLFEKMEKLIVLEQGSNNFNIS